MTARARGGVVVMPWAVCVPDNRRSGVLNGRALLSRRYRAAKEAAHLVARTQWRRPPLVGPVQLVAMVHAPDRRRRDLLNLSKLLHDAMAGVVYADDAQLDDVRYVRGPVDRAQPRVEITLEPCPVEGACKP